MITQKIEIKTQEILDTLNIKSRPVPIEEIAIAQKIKISRAPSKEFSGMLIRKDGHALIGINNNEAPVRQRFSIAHELGHFFLHQQDDTFVDYRKELKENDIKNFKETEADQFAAALLMPKKFLEEDVKKLNSHGISEKEIKTLCDMYKVSEKAMTFRLINLNLFTC
ncbi:MAG: ImmA/IrrE family metallo-endopeptidase [Candidatus Paceibacterota bacterium]|jgi:Zn-dependent peptidase ImmA (M78 family)